MFVGINGVTLHQGQRVRESVRTMNPSDFLNSAGVSISPSAQMISAFFVMERRSHILLSFSVLSLDCLEI